MKTCLESNVVRLLAGLREIREFWERRTEKWSEKAPLHIGKGWIYNWLMTRAHRKQLKKVLKFCKPESVLEMGVGQGRLLSQVRSDVKVGVDVAINMIKSCQKDGSELVQADANHLPFRDKCFVLVYTCTALLHIPDNRIELAISEIKRVAKEYILIIEPLPTFQHITRPYSEGGYCFPHKYPDLFKMLIISRRTLKKFSHEAILFTNKTGKNINSVSL